MNGERKWTPVDQRLEELYDDAGTLRASDVVNDARPKDSVLHRHFEWDDGIAAERHREHQARRIISGRIIRRIEKRRVIETFAYVRDPDAEQGEQGYTRTAELMTDKARAMSVLLDEIKRASAYIARVRMLAIGLGLDGATELVEREMEVLRRSIGKAA